MAMFEGLRIRKSEADTAPTLLTQYIVAGKRATARQVKELIFCQLSLWVILYSQTFDKAKFCFKPIYVALFFRQNFL